MRVPLSWLRDFAPFSSEAGELGEVFDDLGMVVESIVTVGAGLSDVVVGRVVAIEPIGGADKIRKVTVDAGGPDPVQVVCGAWNFSAGDSVPFAPVGAVLPGDFEIGRRTMKGVASEGMLCSARELGLGDDAAGLLVLGPAAAPGTPIMDALGISHDVVYDLAIEANRPDANCVAGVARDAAARLGLPFSLEAPGWGGGSGTAGFAVEVSSPELCDRFTATVFEGVAVGPSPSWIERRLALAGMRPISNVVDASNYVMLELGQPTHAYDLERLPTPALGARAARPGERLTTLDDVVRELGPADCVIVDGRDEAIGIGGIMGGASSEVWSGTSRVALEAAHFVPMAIARTSKRIGLRSEASARFERGVDILGIERSIDRFASLLALTCPDLVQVGATVDWRAPGAGKVEPIRVRVDRVNRVLGTGLAGDVMGRLLQPIGFSVAGADGALVVSPPTFRPDVTDEIDVIEEIARHHGYSNVARTTVRPVQVGALTPYQRARRLVRSVLAGAGLSEAAGGPLVSPGDHERSGLPESSIEAADPLVREESVLRSSLRPGLLRAAAFNHDRRNPDLGLFEIGRTWREPHPAAVAPDSRADVAPGRGLPAEDEVLAVVLAGAGPDGRGGDAPAAVRVLRRLEAGLRVGGMALAAATAPGLHPTRAAEIAFGDHAVGWVGEIDPDVSAGWGIEGRVGWFELDLVAFVAHGLGDKPARPVSRFPSSDLDLAFVVDDEVPAADVESALRAAGGELLEWVRLFDVYRGPGVPERARSLAFRLRFVAADRTLTDTELASVRTACVDAVTAALPATLRA